MCQISHSKKMYLLRCWGKYHVTYCNNIAHGIRFPIATWFLWFNPVRNVVIVNHRKHISCGLNILYSLLKANVRASTILALWSCTMGKMATRIPTQTLAHSMTEIHNTIWSDVTMNKCCYDSKQCVFVKLLICLHIKTSNYCQGLQLCTKIFDVHGCLSGMPGWNIGATWKS